MGRWIPIIEDVGESNNSGGQLLAEAILKYKAKFNTIIESIYRDNIGTFGYETNKSILCAKSYIYGWIVSCHKDLLEKANEKKKPLVMFIKSCDKFYSFLPAQCLEGGTENIRNGIVMVNFDIKQGKNI